MRKVLALLVILLLFASSIAIVAGEDDSGSSSDNDADSSPDSDSDSGDHSSDRSSDSSDTNHADDSPDDLNPSQDSGKGSDDSPSDSSSMDNSGADSLHDDSEIEWEHTDPNEFADHIREREMEIETELDREGVDDSVRNNQSVYLVGVDAFLYVHELHHTYYDNLTETEREIRDTLNSTLQAEMQIQSRNAFVQFFMGGDDQAALQLEREVDANEDRIREMERLIDICNCSEQVQDQLRDRIYDMDQEQDRLQDLIRLERQDTGIFGWIWR